MTSRLGTGKLFNLFYSVSSYRRSQRKLKLNKHWNHEQKSKDNEKTSAKIGTLRFSWHNPFKSFYLWATGGARIIVPVGDHRWLCCLVRGFCALGAVFPHGCGEKDHCRRLPRLQGLGQASVEEHSLSDRNLISKPPPPPHTGGKVESKVNASRSSFRQCFRSVGCVW